VTAADPARQRVLDRAQAAGRLPSLAAGLVRDGGLAWPGASGAPTGPDVQYRIGSITKTMTAVLVLQCRDDGLLSLDEPLGRFVPESGYADRTLRSLLSHVSGMQSEPVGPWWERSPGVPFETLVSANDGSGAVAGPGEWFHYSNLGFALLGEAVARVRSASWWDLVRSRLLAPLGLRRTTYHPEQPFAQGYSVHHFAGTLTEEPHQDTGAMAPAGQLWSTVEDLARWAAFLVRGQDGVLSRRTLQEMAVPADLPAGGGGSEQYGLGLRLLPYGGRWLVGHTGSMPGFMASLFADPATGDGVVALTNATTGFDPSGFPSRLLDPPAAAPVPPWQPTAAVPEWARELLGLWFWGNTALEFHWQNGLLEVRSLALHALEDRFSWRDGRIIGVDGYHRGETLHVQRGPDGTVDRLEVATFVHTRTPYPR
jgi:CubicO group peptidase (beta-lactamase class C family)